MLCFLVCNVVSLSKRYGETTYDDLENSFNNMIDTSESSKHSEMFKQAFLERMTPLKFFVDIDLSKDIICLFPIRFSS